MPCKKLTIKQKQFARKEVELKNGTEAAMQVYNCKTRISASNMASALHKNPKVVAEIEKVLAGHEVTQDTVAETIKGAMGANVVVTEDGMARDSGVADHNTRLRAATTAGQLLDMFPAKKIDQRNINLDLELEKMPAKELAVLLRELAQNVYAEPNNKEEFPVDSGGHEDGTPQEG